MPPFSKTLAEEGAAIKSFKLVEGGVFQEDKIKEILEKSRNLSDNLSDLKAQVSAIIINYISKKKNSYK